jgi:ribosome-binding protein aMBF1 (putative translation factor)
MKAHRTKQGTYKVIIEMPGQAKRWTFVPARYLHKLEDFLQKYGETDAVIWEDLAKERIAKYKKSGLVLRGARYRERLSQKELAKRAGVSQENISKMETGQRPVGEKVAKKLAKALHIDARLLLG